MTAQVFFDLQGNLVKTVNDVPLNEIMPKVFHQLEQEKEICLGEQINLQVYIL